MDYEMINWQNFSLQNGDLSNEDILRLIEIENEIKEEFSGDCIILAAYSLIILISLVGNSLVCKVSLTNPTTTNSLIGSLSVSDLMVTVFNIPLNIVRLLMDEWPFGHLMCFLVPFVQIMAVYVSSLTMAVIAIHRWRSVTSRIPIRPCSRFCLFSTILSTWVLAGLMALPLSIFNQIQVVLTYKPLTRCRNIYPESEYNISLILTIECFITQYIIPLTMACLIYTKIALIISKQGKVPNSAPVGFESRKRSERKRRRIIMLILVVVIFAICWLPINFYHILVDSHIMSHNYNVFIICHWFAMSSVCYNPFIYCSLNSTFRNEAKKLFSFIKSFKYKSRVTNHNGANHIRRSSLMNVELELNAMCAEANTDHFRDSTTTNHSPNNVNNCYVNVIVHQNDI